MIVNLMKSHAGILKSSKNLNILIISVKKHTKIIKNQAESKDFIKKIVIFAQEFS